MEIGRGTIKSVICKENCHLDVVPVDVLVNTLITAAWHSATFRYIFSILQKMDLSYLEFFFRVFGHDQLMVYNCTCGSLNPLTWKDFRKLLYKQSCNWPSKYVTWYPSFNYTTSKLAHSLNVIFFQNVPAMLLDALLLTSGKSTM